MKALMYHYVRESSSEYSFSKHKELSKFINEIKHLKKDHTFLNLFDAINQNLFKRKNIIILTFDDGLKDHLQVKRNLKR